MLKKSSFSNKKNDCVESEKRLTEEFNQWYDRYLTLVKQRESYRQLLEQSQLRLLEFEGRYRITKKRRRSSFKGLLLLENGFQRMTKGKVWVTIEIHTFLSDLYLETQTRWLCTKAREEKERVAILKEKIRFHHYTKSLVPILCTMHLLEIKLHQLEQRKLESKIATYFG
ncbi:uncharacterized protein BX663DRAFT_517561 [Cokeromyces recurvatus]|uniref:uncharacterized protein n=1 Tax=Cokeromyces recurvatus TaxID=90255 RepID=UPI00222040D1|nr:uncharacterized protein BX663DRAFT_517561 [Cokeromyces recurvatus]KAI7900433.1 hypothetical protein BX663DRAFT_517561 [Cokeromyces recurvatus]